MNKHMSEADKILCWLDVGFLTFGLARKLEKKYNCKLFGIYDLNYNLKNSFINQQLVKFEKEWFFWDHILKNHKIDINYLKQFEEKYEIDLWKLAYSERLFSEFNKFYKFSYDEILTILEQECKFFEKILDEIKPKFLIIQLTDFHRNHLLAELSSKKNVKVLMLIPSKLGYKATIASEINKIDELWQTKSDSIKIDDDFFEKYNRLKQTKEIQSGGLNFSIQSKIFSAIGWSTKSVNKKYLQTYDHYGVSRMKALKIMLTGSFKRNIRKKFIDANAVLDINQNEKCIFFPLQVEPERNIDIDASFFSNQLEVIKKIAKSLPVDYLLYVKEHYNMIYRNWRPTKFYKEILRIPNVRFIHPTVDPKKLIKNCSLVITITGTAGLEAAIYGKPTIVFADVIYDSIPSVHKIKEIEKLPEMIKDALNEKVDVNEVNKFLNILNVNSFDFNVFGFHNKVLEKFHNGGFLIAEKIPMNELQLFLDDYENDISSLTDEYIKKMTMFNATNKKF